MSPVFTLRQVTRGLFVDTSKTPSEYYFLDKCHLMQWTTFYDINKIQIFDMDIVEFPVFHIEDFDKRAKRFKNGTKPIDEIIDIIVYSGGRFTFKHRKQFSHALDNQKKVIRTGIQVIGDWFQHKSILA